MGQDKLEAATGSREESGNVGVSKAHSTVHCQGGRFTPVCKEVYNEKIFQRYMYSDKRSSGYEHMSVFHLFWIKRERKK